MCERCESERPSWSEYFMTNAKLAAMRSQDPSTKVGCAIVKDNKLVSIGYNGFPSGLDFT
jgi:dCMP deaminase